MSNKTTTNLDSKLNEPAAFPKKLPAKQDAKTFKSSAQASVRSSSPPLFESGIESGIVIKTGTKSPK